MKNLSLFIVITIGSLWFFAFGYIVGRSLEPMPTPEQCLNVCVDAFERMNC